MSLNLRRSFVVAVAALVITFVYALLGTGLSQLAFKSQADGSITAKGSTLIGQNWAATPCPGHPLGSCVFHGRPDDTGPYAASKTQSGGDNPLVANGVAGESGATNLGPRSSVLLQYTKELMLYWHSSVWTHGGPGDYFGQRVRPTSRPRTPPSRSPWWPRPPESRRRRSRKLIAARPTAPNGAFWAAPT